jgi:hypothetical protein
LRINIAKLRTGFGIKIGKPDRNRGKETVSRIKIQDRERLRSGSSIGIGIEDRAWRLILKMGNEINIERKYWDKDREQGLRSRIGFGIRVLEWRRRSRIGNGIEIEIEDRYQDWDRD